MEKYILIFLTLITLIIPRARKIYFASSGSIEDVVVTQRESFFDFLKGLAMMAVILMHVVFFYLFLGNIDKFQIIMNNLSRFAIPLFFICSGILLNPNFSNKEKFKKFYLKKIYRLLIPYTLVVLVISVYDQESFSEFLYKLVSGKSLVPFYYIVILFQLYLIYPFIVVYRKSKVFLVITFFISLTSFLLPSTRYISGIPLFIPHLFFFVYGIYRRNDFINYKPKKQELWYWLFIVFIYLTVITAVPEIFYNVRLFYGLAIFNLLFYFKHSISVRLKSYNLITKFGQNSLWLYLIHFPLVFLAYFYLKELTPNYYLNFSIIFVVSTAISYVVAYLLKVLYNFIISLSPFGTKNP